MYTEVEELKGDPDRPRIDSLYARNKLLANFLIWAFWLFIGTVVYAYKNQEGWAEGN